MPLSDSILTKIIRSLIYAIVFITPLFLYTKTSELFEFNKMSFVYLITIAITVTWLSYIPVHRQFPVKTQASLPIAIFLLIMLAATVTSIDPYTSVWGYYSRFHGGLASIIAFVILYHAVLTFFDTRTIIRWLLPTVLASAALVSIYGLLQHFGIDAQIWKQDVRNRVFSTLGQPNWLAAYLAALAPFTWAYLLHHTTQIKKTYAILTHPLIVLSLIQVLFYSLLEYNYQPPTIYPIVGSYLFLTYSVWHLLYRKNRQLLLPFLFITLHHVFFICIIYTGSRSGFLAYLTAFSIFWAAIPFLIGRKQIKPNPTILKTIFSLGTLSLISLVLFSFTLGTPFSPSIKELSTRPWIQNITQNLCTPGILPDCNLSNLIPSFQPIGIPQPPTTADYQPPVGGTESGVIRQIVWAGAIQLGLQNPLLGTGLDTFAYSYYWTRPQAHNLVSEWDFLYNKAHNEFLNYWATTGVLGLLSYLFLILSLILLLINSLHPLPTLKSLRNPHKTLKNQKQSKSQSLKLENLHTKYVILAALAGFISLHISHFFGFSVVITSLYFWLLPAIAFVLVEQVLTIEKRNSSKLFQNLTFYNIFPKSLSSPLQTKLHNLLQYPHTPAISSFIIIFIASYSLSKIASIYIADLQYSKSIRLHKAAAYVESIDAAQLAIQLNPALPQLHDHMAQVASDLAVQTSSNGLTDETTKLIQVTHLESQRALQLNPWHINFYKNRAAYFITLSRLQPELTQHAIDALETARILAPTDPKIHYNLALLYANQNQYQKAIELFQYTYQLKPDYSPNVYGLALYLQKDALNENKLIADPQQYQQAIAYLQEYINLVPDNDNAQATLNLWKLNFATQSATTE